MLSIGFDDDEDDRYEDPPFCPVCQNELCTDLFGGWFCEVCSELEDDKETI